MWRRPFSTTTPRLPSTLGNLTQASSNWVPGSVLSTVTCLARTGFLMLWGMSPWLFHQNLHTCWTYNFLSRLYTSMIGRPRLKPRYILGHHQACKISQAICDFYAMTIFVQLLTSTKVMDTRMTKQFMLFILNTAKARFRSMGYTLMSTFR